MDRFGAEYTDPMSELKLVNHVGMVDEYQKEFDRIMTRLVILPEYAISAFITGLKPEIGFTVKNHRPYSLPQAYQLARNTEARVNAQLKLTRSSLYVVGGSQSRAGNYNSFSKGAGSKREGQPFKDSSVSLNRKTTRRLTPTEMSEKRQKGLCFFCDEKFVSGHRCSSNKQLYLLEVAEDGEEDQMLEVQEDHDNYEEDEGHEQNCEISVHALNGIHGFNTLRIMGYTKDGPLNILVAPGSSHNFIDDKLIKKLKGDTQLIKPQSVNVAAGGNRQTNEVCQNFIWMMQGITFQDDFLLLSLGSCDMILGVQWLLPLGDIKLNFQKLTLGSGIKARKW
ncbi:hypothetical protein KY285_031427 [Solanum tuberosum]|nr:hypothetical protein KY285_031427 [Solanum tuberosum]